MNDTEISYESTEASRDAFVTSKAVQLARKNKEYIFCPVCNGHDEKYLFHDDSGRHVRCSNCCFVYINPLPNQAPSSSTLNSELLKRCTKKRSLMVKEVAELINRSQHEYTLAHGNKPKKTLLLGALTPEIIEAARVKYIQADIVNLTDEQVSELLWKGSSDCLQKFLLEADLIILHEFLDHALRPEQILQSILRVVPSNAWLGVVFRDNDTFLSKILRKWWLGYASGRTSFFTTKNVLMLTRRVGAWPRVIFEVWTRQTLNTVAAQLLPKMKFPGLDFFDFLSFKVPLGRTIMLMEAKQQAEELLSIIVPIFNESRYVRQVLNALTSLSLSIDYEIILIESNSTDGSRDIVKEFASHPKVKLILEEKPQGKGHAVRSGLKLAKGSIILIQDADFEYDFEDYETLLRPILLHQTEFVLGSRTLGLEGWKVRRYSKTPIKGWLMNFAQKIFAITYNILFKQKTTDINTMFKVFRKSCLSRFELESNGFELDIELACKLAIAGFSPYEIPVNYCGRGFEDGKKIRFFHDAFYSYMMIYKCFFSSYLKR